MPASRWFIRLPCADTVEAALDMCQPGTVPVLHKHRGGDVVGAVEVTDPGRAMELLASLAGDFERRAAALAVRRP
jgi:hypothetical protein